MLVLSWLSLVQQAKLSSWPEEALSMRPARPLTFVRLTCAHQDKRLALDSCKPDLKKLTIISIADVELAGVAAGHNIVVNNRS